MTAAPSPLGGFKMHPRVIIRCPEDGGLIQQIGGGRSGLSPGVRLFWCRYCSELFAFVGENESGGRLAASFGWGGDGWRVWKAHGSERDVRRAIAAVSQLGPPE